MPVLETLTFCEKLVVAITCGPNTKPAELRVSAGAPTKPVPDKFTKLVAKPLELLDTNNCPLNGPFCVGRNAIFTVQVAFCASDAGQLFVWAKLLLIVKADPPSVRLAVALLPTVIVWVGLAVPTLWSAKVKLAGVRVMKGRFAPVPVRLTTFGLLLPP